MPSLAKSKVPPKKGLKTKRQLNKKLMALVVVVIAAIGAYFLFFAGAATNGCNDLQSYQICNIDQLQQSGDAVLVPTYSGELISLRSRGWANQWDYGTVFRAPNGPLNGAVPVTRVYNPGNGVTLHDFVTDDIKTQKEAKYQGLQNEGVAFYAWTDARQPGTVPVYKIQSVGSATSTLFSTDKAWIDGVLAASAKDPNGWRVDPFGYGKGVIAFYAYPVADCSKQPDFYQPQCDDARKALVDNIEKEKKAKEALAAAAAAAAAQPKPSVAQPTVRNPKKPGAPATPCTNDINEALSKKSALGSACIKAWQIKANVKPVDGKWGPKTEAGVRALLGTPAPAAPPRPPATGDRPNTPPSVFQQDRHLNIYYDGSDRLVGVAGDWTDHIMCDVIIQDKQWRYLNDGNGKRTVQGVKGSDRRSCWYTSRYRDARTKQWVYPANQKQQIGTDGEGDSKITKYLGIGVTKSLIRGNYR